MERRKFIIGSATGITAVTSGAVILANAFSPPKPGAKQPEHLDPESLTDNWVYQNLDPNKTSDLAYSQYHNGGCMYAMFSSVLMQLAEEHGEPYSSFPCEMMKYGASGIGGYGTVCGALNGAAALMGLFVPSKSHRNSLTEDLFSWYEKETLPTYEPKEKKESVGNSISNSVLCHASTAKWAIESGLAIDSKQRSERCSRLTADVARKTVDILNQYFSNMYETASAVNEESSTCLQCHSEKGKLKNIKGKMECAPCHDTSLAHTLFADIHYKLME